MYVTEKSVVRLSSKYMPSPISDVLSGIGLVVFEEGAYLTSCPAPSCEMISMPSAIHSIPLQPGQLAMSTSYVGLSVFWPTTLISWLPR